MKYKVVTSKLFQFGETKKEFDRLSEAKDYFNEVCRSGIFQNISVRLEDSKGKVLLNTR